VARTGRTVLFVSHNIAAVQGLCNRAIWLRNGRVAAIGATGSVASSYLRETVLPDKARIWQDRRAAPGNEWIRLHRGRINASKGDDEGNLSVRTPFAIEIEYWKLHDEGRTVLSVNLHNEQGVLVFNAGPSHDQAFGGRPMPAGLFRDVCDVPGDLLNDGVHRAELYVMQGSEVIYHDPDFLSFTVNDSPELRGEWFGKWPGAVRPNLRWATELIGPLPGDPAIRNAHCDEIVGC